MNWEEYEKDFKTEYYTSVMSEYKRNTTAKYEFRLPTSAIEDIFNYVMNLFLKENGLDESDTKMVKVNLKKDKKPFFLSEYEPGKSFKLEYKIGQDFYTIEFTTKISRGNVKCKIARSVKVKNTIVGLNGRLGNMKLKKETRKQGMNLERGVRNYFKLK